MKAARSSGMFCVVLIAEKDDDGKAGDDVMSRVESCTLHC